MSPFNCVVGPDAQGAGGLIPLTEWLMLRQVREARMISVRNQSGPFDPLHFCTANSLPQGEESRNLRCLSFFLEISLSL
jgi:hypothetical protein